MQDQLLAYRYRLIRRLGEGGMGQVWEAQDETLDRRVAVKVISLLAGGGSEGSEARARFLREARTTARLQHPNIVTIHDFGETVSEINNAPFLVMELLRGQGLDAVARRGPVALPDAARWGAQICDALAEAHRAGILHRDIKPSNVLITASGSAKVLDFGVARPTAPSATADRLTQTGFIVGTPAYMAPEQAQGHPEPSSDLYALGCLLFELVAGRRPFQAPDLMGYLAAHLTQEPPALSSLVPGIPAAWDDLVLTLLCKEPGGRYPHATDLARALRELADRPRPAPSATTAAARTDTAPDRAGASPTVPARGQGKPASSSSAPAPPSPEARPSAEPDPPSIAFSWTGKEPLASYTDTSQRRSIAQASVTVLMLAIPGTLIPLLLHRIKPPGSGQNDPWVALFVLSGAGGLLALCTLCFYLPVLTFLYRTPAWSLTVGAPGIEVSSPDGRREYRWKDLDNATIDKINAKVQFFTSTTVLYEHTGIHIKPSKSSKQKKPSRPAGWPPRYPGSIAARKDKMVPVCVLGPMTVQQRAELQSALTSYLRR